MKTHGMEHRGIEFFITLSRAKAWYNISLSFISQIQIISDQKHYFMLPSVSKEYEHIHSLYDDDMILWYDDMIWYDDMCDDMIRRYGDIIW